MKKIAKIAIAVVITQAAWVGSASAYNWNSSPNNWDNNPNNWENSPNNWKNNPNNWDNSPNRWGNDRIIYDSNGNPAGYAVPKASGGLNVFDFEGNRIGYTPAR